MIHFSIAPGQVRCSLGKVAHIRTGSIVPTFLTVRVNSGLIKSDQAGLGQVEPEEKDKVSAIDASHLI